MEKFLKSNWGIPILITILFFCILPVFFLHQGFLLIDTGREFYIPQQMLNGEVLYKDIFNIYGPLSYQINAILFAIFGVKINTLYLFGILNSYLIVLFTYLISKEFLKEHFSLALSIIIMYSLVFPVTMYNSNLTYSSAIVYALSSFLISLFALIKYVKTENQNYWAYLSCLFAGMSIANKYEFCLFPLLILSVLIWIKPIGIKNIFKSVGCFLLVPFISFASLFIQGLTFADVKNALDIWGNLITSPIIKTFFANYGVTADISKYMQIIKANDFFSIYGFLPIVNFVLFGILFKKLWQDKALFVLALASILVSYKSFFFLNVHHMGAFIFPICLMAFVPLINQFNLDKNILKIFLLVTACIFIFEDFSSLKFKNYNLETEKGNIYTYKRDGESIKYISNYVLQNTKETDKVVMLPEGAMINFLTDRKTENKYLSLIPLNYFDVFGEEKVLEHFKNNLPEVFVILPINTQEYGYKFFGVDYAQSFYEMIEKNYNLVQEQNYIKIFKRKNK